MNPMHEANRIAVPLQALRGPASFRPAPNPVADLVR